MCGVTRLAERVGDALGEKRLPNKKMVKTGIAKADCPNTTDDKAKSKQTKHNIQIVKVQNSF